MKKIAFGILLSLVAACASHVKNGGIATSPGSQAPGQCDGSAGSGCGDQQK